MHMRVKAAAEYIGVSKSYLDKARCYGRGPVFFKIGAAVIYARADLDTWMNERRATSTWQAANDNTLLSLFTERAASAWQGDA